MQPNLADLIGLKALSVNQPWAWFIVNGFKDIENRTWVYSNPGLYFRGRVLIHAGLKMTESDFNLAWNMANRIHPRKFDDITMDFIKYHCMGGIVGEAEVVDIVTESSSPWFVGKQGLVLKNQIAYDHVIPCIGQLGFFNPDFNSRYKEKPLPKKKAAKPIPEKKQQELF